MNIVQLFQKLDDVAAKQKELEQEISWEAEGIPEDIIQPSVKFHMVFNPHDCNGPAVHGLELDDGDSKIYLTLADFDTIIDWYQKMRG